MKRFWRMACWILPPFSSRLPRCYNRWWLSKTHPLQSNLWDVLKFEWYYRLRGKKWPPEDLDV